MTYQTACFLRGFSIYGYIPPTNGIADNLSCLRSTVFPRGRCSRASPPPELHCTIPTWMNERATTEYITIHSMGFHDSRHDAAAPRSRAMTAEHVFWRAGVRTAMQIARSHQTIPGYNTYTDSPRPQNIGQSPLRLSKNLTSSGPVVRRSILHFCLSSSPSCHMID